MEHVNSSPLWVEANGRGPAALFVHGFPLDHTMWSAQLEGLADVRTCLAPDLAGFGRSPRGGAPLTMERHADDLARVLDAYDVERADLVGLSMGGYVALAFLERHGERVRSLALVDTRADADDAKGKAARDKAVEALRANGRGAFAEGMLPKLVAEGAADDVRERLRGTITSTDEDSIAGALVGMRDRPDRNGLLETFEGPGLVICGEEDVLTPPDTARAMAERLPNGEAVIIPGAGHMAPMEKPDEVTAALRGFFAG